VPRLTPIKRQMKNKSGWDLIEPVIANYVTTVRRELYQRWKSWPLDLSKKEVHEVIGALLARQVSLVTSLAFSPSSWNAHVAPIILRSMTDAYISLAWIFKDTLTRSAQFIAYGLGQEKLVLEHRIKQLELDGHDAKADLGVKVMREWIDSQQLTDLTEVNVGSWSGQKTRSMAEEADCLNLFNHAYSPFSSVTHNMWNHIAKYNLRMCENPLHRYHMIPVDTVLSPDIDYLYRAAKYVEKSFRLFDKNTGITHATPSALEQFGTTISSFGRQTSKKMPRKKKANRKG
jgi:hypothetical protein